MSPFKYILWAGPLAAVACFALGVGLLFSRASFADEKAPAELLKDLKMTSENEEENDVRAMKTELLVEKSEQLAIDQVKKLLKKYKGMKELEADLWLRLGELYMRRSKASRFFEVHRKSEKLVSVAPEILRKPLSKTFVVQAVEIYDRIERDFRSFPQMDLVIFNNAFARQQLGQSKNAQGLYKRVIAKFPASPLVPDCHLAVGELAFDDQDFKTALSHFEAIKKYPESRVFPYGLYKSGWTYYNLRQTELGLKELEKVVAFGRKVEKEKLDVRLDLRKEALSDMTLFFGEVYPSERAFEYFKGQAGEMEFGAYISKLSSIYQRHSRWSDRKVILKEFITRVPQDPEIPSLYDDLVWTFENMKERKWAVDEMNNFHKICQSGSRWAEFMEDRQKANYIAALKACQEKIETTSLRLADKWNAIFIKNADFTEYADSSEAAYEIYLRNAEPNEEFALARFNFSEMLFKRKKFRKSSEQYNQVANVTKKPEMKHDSRYSALLSLEKAVTDKWNDGDEKLYKDLAHRYTQENPKGKYRLDVEFKSALIAYEKNRFDEAAPIFLSLGQRYAATEKGRKSQDLYLDILNAKKDFTGLKNYAKTLMASSKDMGDRKPKLQKIYEEAYFSEVQSLEGLKGLEAIEGYKKFAVENAKSPLAPKAWWNAMQLQYKSLDFLAGAMAAEKYQEMFPEQKDSHDALLNAAQVYESMARLSDAARVLERLSTLEKKDGEKWLVLASDFYHIDGHYAKSVPLLERLKKSPAQNVRYHALRKLEEHWRGQGATKNYEAVLREILNQAGHPSNLQARLHFLEKDYQAKDYSKSFAGAKEILNHSSVDGDRGVKARARFIQAEILEMEFVSQSVKSKVERLSIVLALKTEKLEKAQQAYQSVIKYGDPNWSSQALEKLAGLYSHYVSALRSMPMPADIPKEDGAVLRQELEKLAIPLEEKSVEALAQALDFSKKAKLADGRIERLQAGLDRVNMKPHHAPLSQVDTAGFVAPSFLRTGI